MRGAGENAGTGDKLPSIRLDQEPENTERQNSSMSVADCRRSSAQDFLRDADLSVVMNMAKLICYGAGQQQL
jgi:hypothetical protein